MPVGRVSSPLPGSLLPGGSTALVTPQNWLFLAKYTKLREKLLRERTWNVVVRLGEHAFDSPAAAGAFAALSVLTAESPRGNVRLAGLDVTEPKSACEKANWLADSDLARVLVVQQADQSRNPDSIIRFEAVSDLPLLERYATNHQGLSTGDNPRFRRCSWEVPDYGTTWEREQSSPESSNPFAGRSGIIKWQDGKGELWEFGRENVKNLHNVDRRGEEAWGKIGVAIGQMRDLPATLFRGNLFDTSVAVIIPREAKHLAALWAYCSSTSYCEMLRVINKKVSVDNGYLTKVPFDLACWQAVAEELYPKGLPEPHSDDPTQWLFKGDIATAPTHCKSPSPGSSATAGRISRRNSTRSMLLLTETASPAWPVSAVKHLLPSDYLKCCTRPTGRDGRMRF